MGNSRGGETVAEGTRELRARLWRRYMKVVFCSWGPCTRVDDKGLEFEIWSGGVRGIKME